MPLDALDSQIDQNSTARWWVLFGLWLLYASFGLVAVSIAPLVTPIEDDLGMSHAAMGSVMAAWQLVYIFSAIPCGMLLDKIGGQRALLIGVVLIGLSAIGRALASDYVTLLVAVMLFGLGGPIVSSGAPKLVASLFQGSQRGMAMGIYMTGPALGGVLVLTLTNAWLLPAFDMNWRSVMLLWGLVALLSGLVWFFIARRASDAHIVAGGASDHRTAPKQTQVMVDLLKSPAVRVVFLMSVGVFLFNHGLNNWLPELLTVGGMSAVQAGYWAALPTVVGIFGSLIIPRLASAQRRFPILLGLCGAALVASILLQFDNSLSLLVGLLLQGIARSSMMTVLILTLVELPGIGDERAGTASGMFFAAAEIGGVLGPLGIGIVYGYSGHFHGVLVVLSAIALGLCLMTQYLASLVRERKSSEI